MDKLCTESQTTDFFKVLKERFEANSHRHKDLNWESIQKRLKENPHKLWSLYQMELTGGEPDVVGYEKPSDVYVFFDCAKESPQERRSLCYDRNAWDARKQNKPKGSAMELATNMGIEILTESQYQQLQDLEPFDTKTSSWLQTPSDIRKLGGSIFADFRYGKVFIYHNGAESYYAGRGFRGVLRV